jgi:hypothetical protein
LQTLGTGPASSGRRSSAQTHRRNPKAIQIAYRTLTAHLGGRDGQSRRFRYVRVMSGLRDPSAGHTGDQRHPCLRPRTTAPNRCSAASQASRTTSAVVRPLCAWTNIRALGQRVGTRARPLVTQRQHGCQTGSRETSPALAPPPADLPERAFAPPTAPLRALHQAISERGMLSRGIQGQPGSLHCPSWGHFQQLLELLLIELGVCRCEMSSGLFGRGN